MTHTLSALACLAGATTLAAAQLYGSDNAGNYFLVSEIDGTATLVGDGSTYNNNGLGATEIEVHPATGVGFAAHPSTMFTGNRYDALSGASLGANVDLVGAFSGLEYVGDTLYGTYGAGSGGDDPSTLAILDPLTGNSVDVGLSGIGVINGLAYDPATGTMYASTSQNALGNGNSWLVTLDLDTGEATIIGDMGIVVGSIEFGQNGQLFGGGGRFERGNIYTINPDTAEPTLLGETGLNTVVTGLTLLPAPAGIAVLGLAGLLAVRRRR